MMGWGNRRTINHPQTTGPVGLIYHEGDYVEVYEQRTDRWLSARITGRARVLGKETNGDWIDGYPVKGVGCARLPESVRVSSFEGTFRVELIRPRSYRWLPRQEQTKYGE